MKKKQNKAMITLGMDKSEHYRNYKKGGSITT